MIVAKQVADSITGARALIAVCLVWLGIALEAAGLQLAAWLMIADWAGDMLDGWIARRSRVQYRTWIGDHDLEVDMTVSIGLLIFMVRARYVNIWLASGYLLLWVAFFAWQGGIPHSPGMLFQAPIYGWFIWIAVHHAPLAGWSIVAFIACAVIFTWPYFPKVMVPGFLGGLRRRQD
jgi:phosphatidylglycerophosphate synthase